MKTYLIVAALALASAACQAATPRYLLGTDEVPAQAVPTITQKNGVITATFQTVDGKWVKHVLTPTKEKLYGPFGEPVVELTAVIPNP